MRGCDRIPHGSARRRRSRGWQGEGEGAGRKAYVENDFHARLQLCNSFLPSSTLKQSNALEGGGPLFLGFSGQGHWLHARINAQ
ncbi:uncharacterized protein VTP21DRAFT_4179 [Calcarisporiella thermophila]|uniref:uncharacterized protein n=1 Tax=Calcarisporiella thermophila TaxID=911321 RepID=UPI003743172E